MNRLMEIKVSYNSGNKNKFKISSPEDAYQFIKDNWNFDLIEFQEECKVILMNNGSYVLGIYDAFKGGISCTVVDIRVILSVALKCNASSIILVHNHPSGNINPSSEDEKITNKLEKACEIIGIKLLDHLIITKDSYNCIKN